MSVPPKEMLLDDQQTGALERQINGLPARKRARNVFSFATPLDLVIIGISCLAAVVAGGLNPLLTVLYGQLVGSFDGFRVGTISSSIFMADVSRFTLYFVYLAVGVFGAVYISTVGFYYTGERITKALRRAYLNTIIRQNIAFFDNLGAGEITTRITSDITLIQEGITGNLSVSLTATATFISAFVIAFVEYWKLAFILSSTVALFALAGTLGIQLPTRWTKRSLASYSSGASVAEEAISSIRHVTAFGIQEEMIQRYDNYLKQAERPGVKANVATALMISIVSAIPYLSYGLSFWEGSRMLVKGEISISGVTTSTLAIVIGAWSVGRITPNAKAFASCIASAGSILESISRVSPQDPLSKQGKIMKDGCLDITFQDVELIYPSRREVTVLKNLNLVIPPLKTTAIVGASGCGKSSIIGLIERFYTPTKGAVLLGNEDIQGLNLNWLRSQISLVGQEPTLFNTTIFENIAFGLEEDATSSNGDVEALVEEAAKKANAHDFISSLPLGYQTLVGEKGAQLSGGQKQRICIARAMIKNPQILLLDEATSALDVGAERSVQLALAVAAQDRTTIVIAHRLSTIRRADNIVVMSQGRIIEQGTHDELIANRGAYAELVEKQHISSETVASVPNPDGDCNRIEHDGVVEKESFLYDSQSQSMDKDESSDPEKALNATSEAAEKQKSPVSEGSWSTAIKVIGRLSRPEIGIIIPAAVLTLIAGLAVPAQSVIFAELINSLSLSPDSLLRNRVDFWCLMYLALGLGILFVCIGHSVSFAYTTEKLTRRAREQSFRHILRQDVGFFELEENSIGALTSFLSSAPSDLSGLSGPVIGALLTFLATISGGVILSLAIGWKLALVCTATIPFVAGFGWVRLAVLNLFADKIRKTHQDSAAYASEATSAIRTVASLTMEARVLEHYNVILSRQSKKSFQSILQASALYAAAQSVTFLCAALAFWYGGTLISTHEYSVFQFFICFAALISGSQTAGIIFSYAPGMSKAMNAAQNLKTLFERKPDIDTFNATGHKIDRDFFTGGIELRNISFSYQSRKNHIVLDDLSLTIRPGQNVALVGSSGCGKSTVIALLERFFDPTSGQILVDGYDISRLDVKNYRSLISLVGQEPTLYSGTIRDNIVLGTAKGVTEDQILHACKEANIYDYIMSLPEGFATDVGSRGTMLSGGQKQRIAIARALLRNTKILLLDEATAALDSGSEEAVQQALNKVSEKRTTIAVAHRLSTIQNSDVIFVLDKGKLVEVGSHQQLMSRGGVYKSLVDMQNFG